MSASILLVAGARPNFMKVAPIMRALEAHDGVRQTLVHTGQHYDAKMSKVFFDELGLRAPDIDLGVGSGSHAEQTGTIMVEMERVLAAERPDLVVVVGDVNSTMAAALVAAKAVIPIAHVEAGLRSFDKTMPEETNRLVTDRLSQLLLTPSPDADENLRNEGVPDHAIVRIGNVMVDTLLDNLPRAKARGTREARGLPAGFALATLHRPANVDEASALEELVATLEEVATELPIVFPMHPRTRARLETAGLTARLGAGVHVLEPLGYLDFLSLMAAARVVLTDSGRIQEETTALRVPCITLRENTERPITCEIGTNTLVGRDRAALRAALARALTDGPGDARIPDLWDGKAGERAARAMVDFLAH